MKNRVRLLGLIGTSAILMVLCGCAIPVAFPVQGDASLSIQNNFGVAIDGLSYNNTSYSGTIADHERITLTVPPAQTGLHKIRFQISGTLYATLESVYTQPDGQTTVDISPNMCTAY